MCARQRISLVHISKSLLRAIHMAGVSTLKAETQKERIRGSLLSNARKKKASAVPLVTVATVSALQPNDFRTSP